MTDNSSSVRRNSTSACRRGIGRSPQADCRFLYVIRLSQTMLFPRIIVSAAAQYYTVSEENVDPKIT